MKKLYSKYFRIQKNGKNREKVMLSRAVITAIAIIVCLAAMSLTAYAYFSCNVTSGSNMIQAANFEAKITVTDLNGIHLSPKTTENRIYTFNFDAPGTYTVKLEMGGTASTGFCIVRIGETDYHTQQIGVDVTATNEERDYVEFQLNITETATVAIESHWGTSSHYTYNSTDSNEFYIENSDPLQVIVVGSATNSISEPDAEESSETPSETADGENAESEPTPDEVIYTVQSGDTLSMIAERYQTTAERIAAYNELDINGIINAGLVLKIPPDDWQMPVETTEETGTTQPEETTAPEVTEPETPTEPAGSTDASEPTTPTEPVDTTAPAETEASAPDETATEPAEPDPSESENAGD